MKTTIATTRRALALFLATSVALPALATDMSVRKLLGTWQNSPANYQMGRTNVYGPSNAMLAASETWIIVGAAEADEGATDVGAVQVFNAVTGAWVRKLLPPTPLTAGSLFGSACAISGSTAVIGSMGPAASSPGVAYVYNLTNGALLRTLKPNVADGAAGDKFGCSVAIAGNRVLVGSCGDDGNKGSAYIFDLATGAQLFKLQNATTLANEFYGMSVTAEGSIGVVGSTWEDGNRGAAFAYDLNTGVLIRKYQAPSSTGGDASGYCVSLSQGRLAMGAPYANGAKGKVFVLDMLSGTETVLTASDATGNDYFGRNICVSQGKMLAGMGYQAGDRGACYVYDLNSTATTEYQKLLPPDPGSSEFGLVAVWSGNNAVIAAPNDNFQASHAGALYVMGPLTRPMAYAKVAAKNDFAPGAADIAYGTFGDAFISNSDEVAFTSTLLGAGSNGGRDMGAFSDVATTGIQQLDWKSRQTYATDVTVSGISSVAMNPDFFTSRLTLKGKGITAQNNQVVWGRLANFGGIILRSGAAVPELGGGVLLSMPEQAASNSESRLAILCNLRQGPAGGSIPKVDATNDSGLFTFNPNFGSEGLAEGAQASPLFLPATTLLGQFAPRVAVGSDRHFYSTGLTGPQVATTSNTALFRREAGVGASIVAVKNDTARDAVGGFIGGSHLTAFIGEACGANQDLVYRATLTGTPASDFKTTSNEGLWQYLKFNEHRLILRKGQTLTDPAGLKVARIINFWGTGVSDGYEQAFALVQLSGTGVNATNDQALLLWQTNGTVLLLLREGDAAPGCPGTKIGVISRVEVDNTYGNYAVLATLTGATKTTDQALFGGIVSLYSGPGNDAALRRPFLRLRKGQLYDNQPGKVRSISLPVTSITASGAGGTGRGHAISPFSRFALVVEFDNGVRQVMKGRAN